MNGLRMHDKEFERQVQQKTEGLKITPSEGLWDTIEGQLPTEKKRRWPVLWLLALLLVGGSAAIWLIGRNKGSNLDKPVAQTVQQQSVPAENPPKRPLNEGSQALAKEGHRPLAPNPASGPQQGTGVTIGLDSSAKQQPVYRQSIVVKVKNGQQVRVMADNANKGTAASNKDADSPALIAQQRKKGNGSLFVSHAKAAQVNITAGQMDTIGASPSFGTDMSMAKLEAPLFSTIATKPAMADELLRPIHDVPINPLTIPSNAASPTGKAKSHWELGLTFGAGLGKRADDLLSFKKNESTMAPLGSGSPPFLFYTSNSKQFKPGIAYQIGLYLQKHMGQRWYVQTGLSYSYLSNKQTVGSFVRDTVQRLIVGLTYVGSLNTNPNNVIAYSNYYRYGNSTVHTNRIHLLQLPIELQYRLGKQQKWGLQTGIALAYMVQGEMLVYNRANSQYFSSPKANNRIQLSLQTGAAFYPKPQSSLAIGVRLNYNVNSFVKQQIETQRILSGLLYCNMPLKKNKR